MNDRSHYGHLIASELTHVRQKMGWSLDDLANFSEINSLTLRNSIHTGQWCSMAVIILKCKKLISEELCYSYQKALERERIENRKKKNNSKEAVNA